MERWVGKVAVVTGASAGIGKAIAIDLVKAGLIVCGLARRKEKIDETKKLLAGEKGELHSFNCDVTSVKSVNEAFAQIEKQFGRVNILVNNAGILINKPILGKTSSLEDIHNTVNTNIFGLLYATRAAFDILDKTKEDGHIINVGDILSFSVPFLPPPIDKLGVYPSTKFAVKGINEVLRQELIPNHKNVKVSMVCPGVVNTELFEAGQVGDANDMLGCALNPEDISQACLFILGTPPHVQVHELIIKPVGEPF